ncbi:unnamed protein product [Cylindrotheca closterium]|uniref:Helicase-associated domain-containing protein n=1 Tax=Cylindrotheca closterium TaxID=2856 RepID=A0AAD2CGN3_9STRA|nr:unnamed protein product [Cylindrotheca closterium]
MFYLLMVYQEREGHCRVPTSHLEAGRKLGLWLARQREVFKSGKMDPTYSSRLEEVGVVWNPGAWLWDAHFDALVEFKKSEGHCDVPQFHQEKGEYLGTWLNKQRQDYRRGKLPKERAKRLEELGVAWSAFGKRWEQMLDLLVQFKEREGHCMVPVDHREDGKNLGAWVSTQRKAWRSKTLDADRQDMLDSIGMIWSVQEAQWESMFALIEKYVEREQNTEIPLTHVEQGKNLGHWIAKQKQLYRNGKLEGDRQQRLLEVGVLE